MDNNNYITQICQLPHASSLQQLCDITYRIIGNPVFVSDMAHTILAYTRCVEIPDPHWQAIVVGAVLDKNTLAQDREVSIVHERSTGAQRPVLVDDGDLPYPRLIKTLTSQGTPVGVMVVTAYMRPFDGHDADLIDLISSFLLPLIEKESYFMSGNSKTAENYLIQILEGASYSREQVKKRLRVLNFEEPEYLYVLTICARHRSLDANPRTISQLLDQFHRLDCCRTFLYNSTLVSVYGSDHDITDWDEQEVHLTELMRREDLMAGVSRRVSNLAQLREYYRQARDGLEVGLKLARERTPYCLYDNLSSFLLFQSIPREELPRYCHHKIQKLGEYDAAHNTDLCVTLQVYLEQAKSLAKAADLLYIHRNTVRYRINKCMELMNTDLEDGNEIFAYILSLRILEYQKKFSRKAEPSAIDATERAAP